jgi:uroporphyrinogen-III synthase
LIRDSVLLTRAGGNNTKFATALDEISLKLLHRPVLQIEPVEIGARCLENIENLDLYDHIIFISTKLKWFAVGDSTANQLRDTGIAPIVPQKYSSEGLLELPGLKSIQQQRVLIVRGLGGRETLKQALIKRGAVVDYLEVYKRSENHWSGEIVTPFEVDKLLATIVYSAESLMIFDRQISDAVRHLPLLVPSSRVAGIARERGFTRVFAVQPKDEALIGQLVDLKN